MRYVLYVDGVLLGITGKRALYNYYRVFCRIRERFDLLSFRAPVEDILHDFILKGASIATIAPSSLPRR